MRRQLPLAIITKEKNNNSSRNGNEEMDRDFMLKFAFLSDLPGLLRISFLVNVAHFYFYLNCDFLAI